MTSVTDIISDGAETYAEKNEDYGDSWRTVGEILFQLAEGETVELESPEDFVSLGLFTRRLDKMARAFHGEFNADDMNFESVIDAHEDEMVYAAMAAKNQRERDVAEERAAAVDHPTTKVIPAGE
jgi:hypothetical protein